MQGPRYRRRTTVRNSVRLIMILMLFMAQPLFAEETPVYDRVNLSAEASTEVENDTLVAELYLEHQAKTAAEAAQVINSAISWGIEKARSIENTKVRTLDYTTTPVYSTTKSSGQVHTPKIMAWRVSQAMRVESTDTDQLSKLITDLQERLAIRHIGYQVSKSLREITETALIDQAIIAFQNRADQIAGAFGREKYSLVQVNISTSGTRPPVPDVRSMAMEMARSAPVAVEAGSSTLKASINGTIELH